MVVIFTVMLMVPLMAFVSQSDLRPFVYLLVCTMLGHAILQIALAMRTWQSVSYFLR